MKLIGFAMGAAALVAAGAASAATVTVGAGGVNDGYATAVTYNDDNAAAKRGTDNDRANALNALGAGDGKFFEIGLIGDVIFTFGGLIASPGSVIEVTNGNRANYLEEAMIYVGMIGNPSSWMSVSPAKIDNQSATTAFTFAGGPFDAVKFVHTGAAQGSTGGFDIDSVRVSLAPVPLPAAGMLLLGALGGLSFMRRKQNAAA